MYVYPINKDILFSNIRPDSPFLKMSFVKPKRIVRTLPLEDKIKIIKRIKRGEKMGNLAEEYGIGRTTIHDIYNKSRAKIEALAEAKLFKINKRKSFRTGKNPQLEEALYEWYLQEKKTGSHISTTLLFARAQELYKEMYNKEKCNLSRTFMTGFKRRYGINFSRQDEELIEYEDETSELSDFKDIFFKKVLNMELCPSQVYILTESELCWRIAPNDEFAGYKKDRITFLSCANASGLHKLKLLIIGNSNKTKEFGHINLPVYYFGQKINRATEKTFKTWFHQCFVPEVRHWLNDHNLPEKALLLFDGAMFNNETEYSTEDECFTMLFYPAEVRDTMPLDSILLNEVKQRYKRHLLLTASSRDNPIETTLSQYSMVDMFFSLTESWNWLSASKISQSWKRVWESMIVNMDGDVQENNDDEDQTLVRSVAGDLLIPVDSLQKWFDGEEDYLDKGVQEILISNQEEVTVTIPPAEVSREDAIKSFDKCILWAEQTESTAEELALLRKLRDKALMFTSSNSETIF